MSYRPSCSAESGAQLLARLEGRRSLENIEPRIFPEDGRPVKGDVVEFHGGEGTGKTEMLYHLVAHCILPEASGGLEVEVVFVDTDYHMDTLRLVAILERRLPAGSEDAVRSSLARLYVVHCNSSVQLLLTLHYLEGMFLSRPSLSALILDSISAFYWVDRANGGDSLALQEANLRKCAKVLEKLLKDTGIVVFATVHAIMRNYRAKTPRRPPSQTGARRPLTRTSVRLTCPRHGRAWSHTGVTSQSATLRTENGSFPSRPHARGQRLLRRPPSMSQMGESSFCNIRTTLRQGF
ncbi:hypothetical protein GJAV_G00083990 [Gymnothorax javanicus]|nr:hypothetical protein GJAV_G00083990 [Gymnothorax javanicus]